MSFGLFRVFHIVLEGPYRILNFIWTTGGDYSDFVNPDLVQVLNYSKYSFLILPIVGIESATSISK